MASLRSIVMLPFLLWLLASCRKEATLPSTDAPFRLSADTLHFDTLFATTGSVTAGFVIANPSRQPLQIDEVSLAGGTSSPYRINTDGMPGPVTGPFRIEAGDSLYVFASIQMPSGPTATPFLVTDSIHIRAASHKQNVQLIAYGQNARFLRNTIITKDTRFNDSLPYVILGSLQVATPATLTLARGTRVYVHADAPILVAGSLVAEGEASRPVVFTGDRLDEGYRDLPGAWPGIYLRAGSSKNRLTHTLIQNAYNGLVAEQAAASGSYQLTLRQCTVDNAAAAGILAISSSIDAANSLIQNCEANIVLAKGGQHRFSHCTVASFSHRYLTHQSPVLFAADWDSTRNGITYHPLTAEFTNCIFWGSEGGVANETIVSRRGNTPFQVAFQHCLYRGADPAATRLENNIRNLDPRFDSVNTAKRVFDLRIQRKMSPAIDQGLPTGLPIDRDGKPRDAKPDIGCYEKQ